MRQTELDAVDRLYRAVIVRRNSAEYYDSSRSADFARDVSDGDVETCIWAEKDLTKSELLERLE